MPEPRDSASYRQAVKKYLRSEAEEIAGIAEREVAQAMRAGNNIGFDPELEPVQVENSKFHIQQYPPHRDESAERDPRDRRALHNWLVMYRAHGARTRKTH